MADGTRGADERAGQTTDPPLAARVTGREWVLAVCLLAIANDSVWGVLAPLLERLGAAQPASWIVRSTGHHLLLVVVGACVRPRALGALIIATTMLWLLLDALAWANVFDVYMMFAPQPHIFFEF